MPDERLQQYLETRYGSQGHTTRNKSIEDGGSRKKKVSNRRHLHATLSQNDMVIRDEENVWFGQDNDHQIDEEVNALYKKKASANESLRVPQLQKSTATQSSGWTAVRPPSTETSNMSPKERVLDVDPNSSSYIYPDINSQSMSDAIASDDRATVQSSVSEARPQAGLMSREQLRAQREARKAAEKAAVELQGGVTEQPIASDPQETVYRDALGRRINPAEEEAQWRAEEDSRKRKAAERAQWNRGLVQRRQEAEQRADLAQISTERVARYVCWQIRQSVYMHMS